MIATGERIRANTWGSYYAVCDQPADESEERAVRAAMAACPLKCIRDDWEG